MGSIALVVAAVMAMVFVATLRGPGTARRERPAGAAADKAQHVPPTVLSAVGFGKGISPPLALPPDTPPLELGGKPEVLYIGADYCPFCAAQRWPLIVALGRFGSFSNLGGTESAAGDIYPLTQTFTFHGATYTSDYLTFVGVETNTNQPDPSGQGYTPLERPTQEQVNLISRYDRPPYTSQAGAIPFVLIGNRFVSIGASYQPTAIQGLSRDQIAAALSDPLSAVAQSIGGSTNALTAAICELTAGRPAGVCTDPLIAKIQSQLPSPP